MRSVLLAVVRTGKGKLLKKGDRIQETVRLRFARF
jgi:hypothetical protein